MTTIPLSHPLACSFCGRPQRDTRTLIAGPQVYICDDCVTLCAEIIVERKSEAGHLTELTHNQTDLLAEAQAELKAAQAVTRDVKWRVKHAFRVLGEAHEAMGGNIGELSCTWCGHTCRWQEMREHVATCEKHPAVIRLREIEAENA